MILVNIDFVMVLGLRNVALWDACNKNNHLTFCKHYTTNEDLGQSATFFLHFCVLQGLVDKSRIIFTKVIFLQSFSRFIFTLKEKFFLEVSTSML